MSKKIQIEVITYEQERLAFFTKAMQLAQKRYNRLFKIFKDEPYLSEGTTIVSDAGRESQFYHDIVEMLENDCRKQSEGEWLEIDDGVSIGDGKHLECSKCGVWKKDKQRSNFCPDCGAKMKDGAE